MPTLQEIADSYAERLIEAEKAGTGSAECRAILKRIDSLTWDESGQPLSSEEKQELIRKIGTGRRLIKEAADNRALLDYVSYMLSQVQDRKK